MKQSFSIYKLLHVIHYIFPLNITDREMLFLMLNN
jgi:hypothetical protein